MMKAGYVPPEIWRIGKSIGELWEMVGKLVPPQIRRIGKKQRWIPRCRLQYSGLGRTWTGCQRSTPQSCHLQ